MDGLTHVYIFGDETFDYRRNLSNLVHQESNPLVTRLFEKIHQALRAEIGRLPTLRQREFLKFSNFAELAAQAVAGALHPSIDLALACTYQLAQFIR